LSQKSEILDRCGGVKESLVCGCIKVVYRTTFERSIKVMKGSKMFYNPGFRSSKPGEGQTWRSEDTGVFRFKVFGFVLAAVSLSTLFRV
jgi:hypothetical protein